MQGRGRRKRFGSCQARQAVVGEDIAVLSFIENKSTKRIILLFCMILFIQHRTIVRFDYSIPVVVFIILKFGGGIGSPLL